MCVFYTRRSKTQWFFLILLLLVAILIFIQWNILMTPRMRRFSSRLGFKDVVIPGWEPGKIMPVGRFIRPSDKIFIHSGNKTCPKDPATKILIIVCSRAENHEERAAIRNTWALDASNSSIVSVIFFLGVSGNGEINALVTNENEAYDDMVVGNFIDTVENATLKSVAMLRWITEVCGVVNYVMKTVDDAFLNIPNLIRFVDDPSFPKDGVLYGALKSKELVQRDSNSDRFMPKYMYPYETYPDYLNEAGYLMSVDVVRALYFKAIITSYIHLEDVFVTGLSAEAAQIKRTYDFRFYPMAGDIKGFDCSVLYQKNLIVHSYKLSVFLMFEIFDEYKKCFP